MSLDTTGAYGICDDPKQPFVGGAGELNVSERIAGIGMTTRILSATT